jgi:hypothetical protein
MKPAIKIRKVITASLFITILGGVSLVSQAGTGHDRESAGHSLEGGNREGVGHSREGGDRNSAGTAEVKYFPDTQGQGIFNVQYNNVGGNRFTVCVLDADGNQLYQNIYTDKKFDKNFRLADPDGYGKLIFVIQNLVDKSVQRFEVEASSHLVEDVDVREVR